MTAIHNTIMRILAAVVLAVLAFPGVVEISVTGQERQQDALEQGFKNPPDSAKPRVWWHWMNGNITKEGIRADLEWMKRVGIGGFQNFDASLGTPQIVDKRLVFMTAEWKDAFRYTTTLADQLGLEMAIAGSPGWSESGGPWVPPAQAMKKLVWSETRVEGGHLFTGLLPKPPSITGPFQNIRGAGPAADLFGDEQPRPEYYADSAVIAFRASGNDLPLIRLQPKITSSGGHFDITALGDGDFAAAAPLPKAPLGEKAWIQFEFAIPQAIHAVTLGIRNALRNPFAPVAESGQELEASDDGQHFKTIATVPGGRAVVNTIAFSKVKSRFFRITFRTLPDVRWGGDIPGLRQRAPATTFDVTELLLHTSARVNRFEEKAGFAVMPDLYSWITPVVSANDAVSRLNVIDITSKMRPDGTLAWTAPLGDWVVLRFGYSLLGIHNHPASPEATGLEVDKLNRNFVKAYMDKYLGKYKEAVGPLMGKRGLQYVITDSWEAGAQNWTDEMIAEFSRRRGYDMRPWMPVLTGRVVESAEASERFLWDFRKTIGDLTVESHYDQITASLRERGMGRYTESHESGRALIADGMEVKRNAEVPMSAMWTPRPGEKGESFGYNADIRESASVAHIYGQNLVAAESLTAIGSAWAWSPETLKPTADKELAMGLNRFVIHTSVHQPVSDKVPGLGLGPFGQWFTRHETWAEQAHPWLTYLARSCYMLQQGKFAADVIYFYGEDSNITALFGDKAPPVPEGYNFDFVNADALIHHLSTEGERITTPSGMSYRVLALDSNSRYMSLPVLRKIRDLVNVGAYVIGSKPIDTPSLSDDKKEFRAIADQLWGAAPGAHSYGKGKVYSGLTISEVLAALKVDPDFEYTKPQNDTNLLFVHRALVDGEVYWVNNRNNRVEILEASIRVAGNTAELWFPETGRTEPASYRIVDGRTIVPMRLNPHEAVFVVFRHPTTSQSRMLPKQLETSIVIPDGEWEVSFQQDRGAPAKTTLNKLNSWSESADLGVKYFSGTGTYTRIVNAQADWLESGSRLYLDLGDVKNLAEVLVNGKSLGIVWKVPFRVDVTDTMKPGANTLEIRVTNLWVNRLIGDQQPNVSRKYSYTTMPFYKADSPLLPSGLLGPVQFLRVAAQ